MVSRPFFIQSMKELMCRAEVSPSQNEGDLICEENRKLRHFSSDLPISEFILTTAVSLFVVLKKLVEQRHRKEEERMIYNTFYDTCTYVVAETESSSPSFLSLLSTDIL